MKDYFKKVWETIDSKSTLSNMRFNVTWVTWIVCICLVAITLSMCWMLHKRYVTGAEITAFAVVIIGYGSVAFGYKNAQAKTEQLNNPNNDTPSN